MEPFIFFPDVSLSRPPTRISLRLPEFSKSAKFQGLRFRLKAPVSGRIISNRVTSHLTTDINKGLSERFNGRSVSSSLLITVFTARPRAAIKSGPCSGKFVGKCTGGTVSALKIPLSPPPPGPPPSGQSKAGWC